MDYLGISILTCNFFIFGVKYIRHGAIDGIAYIIMEVGLWYIRRTFATFLLYNNTNIKTIQNILGHSSIMMTERYLANDSKKELDTINKLCFI